MYMLVPRAFRILSMVYCMIMAWSGKPNNRNSLSHSNEEWEALKSLEVARQARTGFMFLTSGSGSGSTLTQSSSATLNLSSSFFFFLQQGN